MQFLIFAVNSEENYTISAKNIEYKDNKKIIIANGSAKATYGDYRILSENIVYNKINNTITSSTSFNFIDDNSKITISGGKFKLFINEGNLEAFNNIKIIEKNNFYKLETLNYSYRSKQGSGSKLFAKTSDGTTYKSKSVEFDLNKQIFVYNKNNLTNCKQINNSKNEYCPVWSINSSKTTHDIKNKILVRMLSLYHHQ